MCLNDAMKETENGYALYWIPVLEEPNLVRKSCVCVCVLFAGLGVV